MLAGGVTPNLVPPGVPETGVPETSVLETGVPENQCRTLTDRAACQLIESLTPSDTEVLAVPEPYPLRVTDSDYYYG